MEATLEQLTPSETAIAAGVSVPGVHRVIDEHILPEEFFDSSSGVRRFRSDATILIAFYFDTAAILTKNARLRTNPQGHGPVLTLERLEELRGRRPRSLRPLLSVVEQGERSFRSSKQGSGDGR